jgi:Tol biopolymer transport system component
MHRDQNEVTQVVNASKAAGRQLRFAVTAFFAALIIGLLAPASASAQYFGRNKVQYDQFKFNQFETEHFDFFLYDEEEVAVKDAARMAERWYKRHSRTFLREFKQKKPIIFYANDADFQQTNAISGSLGQGTGGVTEALKERVIMPLTGLYKETDHVLGHELVHSFQYDIGLAKEDTNRFALGIMPLWLIEGTAEYLSVGRNDSHTAMWLRDAAIRDDLPTIKQLSDGYKYFPYRYGQAYMAYIGGKYGDAAVANIYKLGGRIGLDSAFVYTLGIKPDSLSKEWIAAVKDAYLPLVEGKTPADSAGHKIVSSETAGDMNIAPAISPDGKWIAFLSEKDLFNINLFIADAETGKVVRSLKGTNSDPHFDAIRFINSSGSWSPDGRRFAFITFVQGDNELALLDWNTGEIERRIAIQGVSALSNPAWSPDGNQIAFSGMDGGISDLYVFDIETGGVKQLTNDRYGDLQPAWSPDGKTIAFLSDRGPDGTNFDTMDYANVRLSFFDVETGEINTIVPFEDAVHANPQYSPDGRSVYFTANPDGFKDIYRYSLDNEQTYRVTQVQTGISGITSLSPALSVAAQSGRLAYSVFQNNSYTIFSMEASEAQGELVGDSALYASGAGILPPKEALTAGLVSSYLDDPLSGLPDPEDYDIKQYSARLRLDYVAPPSVGVSVGGPFGTGVGGGIGLFFSDMLGNHNLTVVAQANGTFKDIGGQVQYLNQKNRFNYGGGIGHTPYLLGGSYGTIQGNTTTIIQERQRIFIDSADLRGSYPFSTTRRIDVQAGFVRYGFDFEREIITQSPFEFTREKVNLPSPDPFYFFSGGASFVGDYSNFGFTSPIQGGRYRLQATPFIGSATFMRGVLDYRRYKFVKPVTFAIRGTHVGNYFAKTDPNNPDATIFTDEYLGYGNRLTFLRGYSFYSLDAANECPSSGECPLVSNLLGSRVAVASAEIRLPLFGNETLGLINFPYLPTEISLFADAGLAWDSGDRPVLKFAKEATSQRTPLVSAGVSGRFNLFGYMVMEVFYVYPFQRPEKGAHFGIQLVPGW